MARKSQPKVGRKREKKIQSVRQVDRQKQMQKLKFK